MERVITSAEQAQANIDALFAFMREKPKAEKQERKDAPETKGTELPPPTADAAAIAGAAGELRELPISLLLDFPNEKHPFRPYTDEEMSALIEDVRLHGVLQPVLVRPHPTRRGYYEIIAGHNRRTAARKLGYTTLPCVVRDMDDDEALLQMISSNLRQRERLLPSEKAWAYRYELEALGRQGIRRDMTLTVENTDDLTSTQAVSKLRSDEDSTFSHDGKKLNSYEEIAQQEKQSRMQIYRYIRLTYLMPSLLELVDNRKLPLTVGVVLSHISLSGQQIVENFFFLQRTLPVTQPMAERCRELDARGELSEQALEAEFLAPPVVKRMKSVNIKLKKWRKYFDEDATQQQVVDTIEAALKEYFEKKRGEGD